MNNLVLFEKKNAIAMISLNRPEKRNALNIPLLESLLSALNELKKDPDCRALIIKGEGPAFCCGLDLKEASDDSTASLSNELLAKILTEIYKAPYLTIAAVQGFCLAGGAGILSASDFVIAESSTLFGYPEVKKGLVAALVMVFLKKQLKERDLKELLLFGELINTEKALSMGLINKIADKEMLMQEAFNTAEKILKTGKNAISKTKELLADLSGNVTFDLEKMKIEGEKMRLTKEAKEGIAAFLEHRDPVW